MSDPFKLRVLKAVTSAVKEITPANEYVHDLADVVVLDPEDEEIELSRAACVFRGRAWFGEGDPIPMVSILEGVSPADAVGGEPPAATPSGEYDWPILIQGFVEDDPEHPTDPAYVLLAELRLRMAAEVKRKVPGGHQPDPFGFGKGVNRITGMRISPGVVRPADDVSGKAYLWFLLTLRIFDNPADPYG